MVAAERKAKGEAARAAAGGAAGSLENKGALVLDGGKRMRLRSACRTDISDEQIEMFFITLAETCNVVRSARAGGFSANWAYRKRRRDAAFRNGWAKAVREGYAKLELVLLERAMKGTAKPIIRRDGSERIIREYSTALAVALLRRHAETADEAGHEHNAADMRETRDRILDKLDRIRAREAAKRGGRAAIETKAAGSRIETIRWALSRKNAR